MSTENKPPMAVWLRPHTRASDEESQSFWPTGDAATLAYLKPKASSEPYVHLDQFLEAVKSVADGKYSITPMRYGTAYQLAAEELAKEIKEQK